MHKYSFIFLFLFVSTICHAQICSGSLGDPVVNITFGTGSGSGGPLSGSTTNYTYTSVSCPADGSYTVVNNSSGCFSSSWHTVPEDHTPGDNNGFMMLVNASFNPGDFYVETINGLCESTTYEFSAWILNILKTSACNNNGIQPNLTFKIETTAGVELGKYETGSIAQSGSPTWKQYGIFFKTPAGANKVVVRITNNAPGGCGNDLVLDDITFRPCGPTVTAATLHVSGAITDLKICDTDNSDYLLSGNISTGYQNPAYQWQVSVNNGSWTDIPAAVTGGYMRKPTAAGLYRYRITVAEAGNITLPNCRVVSNIVSITVHPKPVIAATSNSPVCEGGIIALNTAAIQSVAWTGPNGFSSSRNSQLAAIPTHAGKYYVTGTSDEGCVNTDSTIVLVNPNPVAAISNDVTICEGTSTVLSASGGSSYEWTPAIGLSSAAMSNPLASPGDTTRYQVIVSNSFACKDTANVRVNVLRKPVAQAGPDKKIREGQTTSLDGAVSGTSVTFYWSPAAFMTGNSLSPQVSPTSDIIYTLHAVSNAGCGTATDNVFVRVFKKVVVPNAFSPNGDGINDVWQIEALETYPEAIVTVFNRHGQQVYFSRGYSAPWKGTLGKQSLPAATYYYTIDLKNEFPLITGWVMILK